MSTARTRRMQITCNNPEEKGLFSDRIKEIMQRWKTEYYCFCFETGEQGTDHFHLYIKFVNPQSTRVLSKAFGNAHVEIIRSSSSSQNRDYIRKEGAYLDSEKKETNHIETFYESTECPDESEEIQGRRTDIERMISLVQDGASNVEIVQAVPSMALKISALDQYRQAFYEEQGKQYRDVTTIYIYGRTRTGKTSSVYANHDPSEICSVMDYKGTGVWDQYDTARTRVLLLDEYRSSLKISELLAICDGQPHTLRCRYSNRVCLHDTVYIISNISLLQQHKEIQRDEPESWEALLARIKIVRHYYDVGKYRDYSVQEYLQVEADGMIENPFVFCDSSDTPFVTEKKEVQNGKHSIIF